MGFYNGELEWLGITRNNLDVYQKTNQFVAIALTSAYDVPAMRASSDLPGRRRLWRVFRGRILGPHSPHLYIPNPCDLATTVDPVCAANLIVQHTEFVLVDDFYQNGGDNITRNDIVNVILRPGSNNAPFDLQFGDAVSINRRASVQVQVEAAECETLEEIFDNSSGTAAGAGAGSGTTGGSAGSMTGDTGGNPNGSALQCYFMNLNESLEKVVVNIPDDAFANGDIAGDMAAAAANVLTDIARALDEQGADAYISVGSVARAGAGYHDEGNAIDFGITTDGYGGGWASNAHYWPARYDDDGTELMPADDEDWKPSDGQRTYIGDDNVAIARQIMSEYHMGDDSYRHIDEYNFPSEGATGPHFHLDLQGDLYGGTLNWHKDFVDNGWANQAAYARATDWNILEKCEIPEEEPTTP